MRMRAAAALLVIGLGTSAFADEAPFHPPVDFPEGDFGKVVAYGERIFMDTKTEAPAFVGNALACRNCHLDRGRLADSAPMWGAYPLYPQYRAKNKRVDTISQRIQDCFRFSMNGKAPPAEGPVMVALQSYLFWLAKGTPTGTKLKGQGYPVLAKAELPPSPDRGRQVYAEKCVLCHGADGQGTKEGGQWAFPPLWGPQSFNWGAGMHRVATAAGFIKANMPLGLGGSLSNQEAWDVAAFVDSRPRPQDPRFTGDVTETNDKFHGDGDYYGQVVDGILLGGSAPSHPRAGKKE